MLYVLYVYGYAYNESGPFLYSYMHLNSSFHDRFWQSTVIKMELNSHFEEQRQADHLLSLFSALLRMGVAFYDMNSVPTKDLSWAAFPNEDGGRWIYVFVWWTERKNEFVLARRIYVLVYYY